jgi:site-specific recombinase XerD
MSITLKSGKFPLWLHPTGQWGKKIRGKYHYFGKDKDAALVEYVRVKDDLEAGRTPRERRGGGITVEELATRFLDAKREKKEAGDISGRMWSEYHRGCETVVNAFGKSRIVDDLTADDFGRLRTEYAKRVGTYTVAKLVQVTRTLFKFAKDEGLIDRDISYGDRFKKPSARQFRRERNNAPAKLIDAATAWQLIDAAPTQLRAMIYLGLNAGLGQSDCAKLPRKAIAGHWLTYPRPKTEIKRRAYLWPETVAALEAVHAIRPDAANPADADLVFLTKYGLPWVKYVDGGPTKRGTQNDSVSREFKKLADRCKLELPGGPYLLRKTYRTIADAALDPVAVDYTMGHADPSMGAVYRERIDDSRLEAVANHVRAWLLEGKKAGAK